MVYCDVTRRRNIFANTRLYVIYDKFLIALNYFNGFLKFFSEKIYCFTFELRYKYLFKVINE